EKVRERLDRPEIRKVLLTGIEAHVCVGQTALDLLAQGYRVYIACDAVGSRRSIDRDVALRRLENAGVVVTTAEAAVFEWLMVAGTDDFRQVSALVKEPIPQET